MVKTKIVTLKFPTHKIFAREVRGMERFVLRTVSGTPGLKLFGCHALHVTPSRFILPLLASVLTFEVRG